MKKVIEVQDLRREYVTKTGWVHRAKKCKMAVDGIDFFVNQSAVAKHVHTVMLHPDRTNQHLHIGAQLFIRLRLIGIKQIHTFLFLVRLTFPVLRAQQTNAEQTYQTKYQSFIHPGYLNVQFLQFSLMRT